MTESGEPEQAYINAAELLDGVRNGAATELRGLQVQCSRCRRTGGRTQVLARFYEARDDDTGKMRVWVRVPPFKHGAGKTPARAAQVAWLPGEKAVTLSAQCSICRTWWLVFPGGKTEAELVGAVGQTVALSHRPGRSASDPHEVGDPTVVGTLTDERIFVPVAEYRVMVDGKVSGGTVPIGAWLVAVDGSAWGAIVP